jgi:hypothetical protein
MNIAALATEQLRLTGFNVTYGPYSEGRVEGILRKLWADALHEIICLLEYTSGRHEASKLCQNFTRLLTTYI